MGVGGAGDGVRAGIGHRRSKLRGSHDAYAAHADAEHCCRRMATPGNTTRSRKLEGATQRHQEPRNIDDERQASPRMWQMQPESAGDMGTQALDTPCLCRPGGQHHDNQVVVVLYA